MFTLNNFYRLTKSDIKKASEVLARAFVKLSLYKIALEEVEDKSQVMQLFFEVAVRYSIRYGFPYASSHQLEGIALWLPPKYDNITAGRMIRSGGLGCMLKLARSGRSFLATLGSGGLDQIDKDRHENMAGRLYLDLMTLGVDPEVQKKGVGSKLVNAMLDKTKSCGYSMYVTADCDNVDFYKKLGFTVIKEIHVSVKNQDLPMWEMSRHPYNTPYNG